MAEAYDADQFPLAQKKVLILGGSSGIGLATAAKALHSGAEVILAGRTADKLKDAKKSLHSERVSTIKMDATNSQSIIEHLEHIGDLDHLVLSAGENKPGGGPFSQTSLEEGRRFFDENYWAAVRVLREVVSQIRPSPHSSVTFVTGGLARRPIVGKSYTVSFQAAIEGLAHALVDELAPIRVNVMAPGLLKTPFWSNLDASERESLFKNAKKEVPVGFIPNADPIGSAIVELMSNIYICGAVLCADGGWASSRS